MNGHFAGMCKTVKSDNSRGRGRNNNRARKRRMNLIDQDDGPSETGSENDEVNMVLHVNGTVNQPIVMKRKTNKETFTAISVSGSQIKTFTQADLQKNSQSWSDFGAINAEK